MLNQLSDKIHRTILGRSATPRSASVDRRIQNHLDALNVEVIDKAQPINFPLPAHAPDWRELEEQILDDAYPYLSQVDRFKDINPQHTQPEWKGYRHGWQRWDGRRWVKAVPPSTACIIDFEAVPTKWHQFSKSGKATVVQWSPVCAIALYEADLYMWVVDTRLELDELPTLAKEAPSGIWIGHNISYDLQYCPSAYLQHLDSWEKQPMGVCTQSMWMPVRGHCNQQRAIYASESLWQPEWVDETATGSLDDIHRFYFGVGLDKGVRDEIVEQGWEWVRHNMSTVLRYCYDDVLATLRVFQKLYPEYLLSLTHNGSTNWVTVWARMLLSQMWIPFNKERYEAYFNNAEESYRSVMDEIRAGLLSQAYKVWEEYRDLIQVRKEDEPDGLTSEPNYGTSKGVKVQKGYRNTHWVGDCGYTEEDRIIATCLDWYVPKGGEKPAWLTAVEKNPSPYATVLPIILKMTWENQPIYTQSEGKNTYYYAGGKAIPHPDHSTQKVTSLVMKGFKDDARLDTRDGTASQLIQKLNSTLIWVSLRKRVKSLHVESPEGYPVLKPQVGVSKTITARCADPFSQVLPKPKSGAIGAGIRGLWEAPQGTVFGIADFDQQELLVAALIGDMTTGYKGSSAFSLAVHAGRKEDKTTVHWLLAIAANIELTLAKNATYGGLYGLSTRGLTDYFIKGNRGMSRAAAAELAVNTLTKQKGEKSSLSGIYYGGTASPTFNQLVALYSQPQPRGVLDGQAMTQSLTAAKRDFITTKQNWMIQQSGAAMRDRLIAYVWMWARKLNIPVRLVMTVHDEAVWLTHESRGRDLAYCINLAHLYVQGWMTDQLGLDCLPVGTSFFNSVDIDRYWRKDVTAGIDTPDLVFTPPNGVAYKAKDFVTV